MSVSAKCDNRRKGAKSVPTFYTNLIRYALEAMVNNIRKVKRELKLAEWHELLNQQAQSSKKKYEWCKEHGITKDQFYYWQRLVREAMLEDAGNRRSVTGNRSSQNEKIWNTKIVKDSSM